MNDNPVAVSAQNFNLPGGPGLTQLLMADQRRVYFIVTVIGFNPVGLAIGSNLDASQLFYFIAGGATQRFLKRDYGPLVTGEVWLTDGAGNTPATNLTVTTGVE